MTWFRRQDPRVHDELRYHRDRMFDDFVGAGMDRKEAERRAFLEFGNVAGLEEQVRDARGRWAADFANDLRYAARTLGRSPLFAAVAVLSLALGIGANAAIFSVINAVMLRSLPVADPDRLYRIGDGDNCCVNGGPQDRWGLFSYPLFERLKAEAPEFEQLTAFQAGGFRVSVRRPGVDVAARSLRSEYVTGTYFTTFGIGAFGGRVFTADDDTPASPPVVVISHHSWEAIYGGDQSLVGQTLVIEGHPFTVAGVAPPGFFGDTLRNNPPDLWIPLQHEPMVTGANSLLRQPVSAWLRVIGRL